MRQHLDEERRAREYALERLEYRHIPEPALEVLAISGEDRVLVRDRRTETIYRITRDMIAAYDNKGGFRP